MVLRSVRALTNAGLEPRHGSALAHKAHIFSSCFAHNRRVPRSRRGGAGAWALTDRGRTGGAGRRAAQRFRRPGRTGPKPSQGDSRQHAKGPRGAPGPGRPPTPATPRTVRDVARRGFAGNAQLDRGLRVGRQSASGVFKRHVSRQVPVRLRHLGFGRRIRRSRGGLGGRAGLPRRTALLAGRVEPLAGLRLIRFRPPELPRWRA